MKLSLVTGTRNRPESFRRLLDSVIKHTAVDWEMIVADASCEPVSDVPANVTVLHEKPPRGYVRGYNVAFKKTRGEWVIWLNDDAEVLPGYDKTAIAFMDSHPKIGLGCLSFSDRMWADSRVLSFWGIPYANFGIIRRELGNQIGWFWEDIRMYGSDNAITFDVLLQGKGIGVIPGHLIHHHRTDDDVRRQNQAGRAEDAKKLDQRYRPQIYRLRSNHRALSA